MRAGYVLVPLLLPLAVLAQPAVEQEILRLETERVALVKNGKGDWSKFHVDDYIGQRARGEVVNLAQTRAQKPDPQYAVGDVTVHVYGNAALTTGVQTPGGNRVRFLRVWTKQPAGWRIVAAHGTQIIAPGKPDDRMALATAKLSSITTPAAVSSVAREVLKVDQQYADADRRNDPGAAKRMETDRFFFVSRTGNVETTASSAILKDLRLADVRVRTYGDLAIVTGQVQWTDRQGFSPGPLRFTRVWVKQAGEWKVAAEQRTAITASRTTSH